MRRRRRRHPNWPYRLALLTIALLGILYVVVQTWIGATTFARRPSGTQWGLALVSSLLDATIAAWFIAVGASIGSFLNVVAYRLPLGRKIGGHSACPYCRSPIRASDNIPILAWIKLRGRCRVCGLPISAQYPLVELLVAVVFFLVYLSEFYFTGGNLPGVTGNRAGVGGLARIAQPGLLAARLAVYLFALSGLIAAALIAARARVVPLILYVWSLTPVVIASLIQPALIIVPWWKADLHGPLALRLDALTTLICGSVAGIAVARLLGPVVYPGFDRTLVGSDSATAGARQFAGAMAVGGALVGWQSAVPLGWTIVLMGLLGAWLVHFFRWPLRSGDLTVWAWSGLLVHRALWKPLDAMYLLPETVPSVIRQVLGALLLAVLAYAFRCIVPTFTLDRRAMPAPDQTDTKVDDPN